MSGRAQLVRAAAAIFAQAGDLARPATLTRVSASYDPATGDAGEATTTHDGLAILDLMQSRAGDDDPASAPGHRFVWTRGFAQAPRRGDRVSIDGTTRDVVAVEDLVGAGALWRLTLRDVEAP